MLRPVRRWKAWCGNDSFRAVLPYALFKDKKMGRLGAAPIFYMPLAAIILTLSTCMEPPVIVPVTAT